MATFFPGYAVPIATGRSKAIRGTSTWKLVAILGTGIALVAATLVAISALTDRPPTRFMCPPECGRPPMGEPVATNPVFTAPDGSFSVSYPVASSAYRVSTSPTGVTAEFTAGDGGMLQLFSEPARGRDAESITRDLVRTTFPDTTTVYTIPNAMVGYRSGFGIVADHWPQGATSNYVRMRVLVLVAVKDDLALIASAIGPYREFGPDSGAGKPSGANLQLALDMGKYVNSFRWAGDPEQ